MDAHERKIFWDTLCSLQGNDLSHDVETLKKVIKLPKFLFRYRSVNSNNLEALRTNKLYFSTANYYDDPFDTFLKINIASIYQMFSKAFQTAESTATVTNAARSLLEGMLPKEQVALLTPENVERWLSDGLINKFFDFTLALRNEIKKEIWSVCFSENGFNEVLWLKYADQHRGFVQIYDLANEDNYLCGKQEKCKECGIKNFGTPLYPIYYSDTPYDATSFSRLIILQKVSELFKTALPKQLYTSLGNGLWEHERITLIKKKCHEYDEEWRMITACSMAPPVMMEWIPSGIILGLKMCKAEENLVISMAKEAGIQKIYRSFIDSENQLSASLITP